MSLQQTSGSSKIAQFFRFGQLDTGYCTALLVSLTVFITCVSVLIVVPQIMGNTVFLNQPGDLFEQLPVAAVLCLAIASILIGLLANSPIALGPGTGIDALFAFLIVLGMSMSWRPAFTAVLVEGIVFTAVALSPYRRHHMDAIPASLSGGVSLPAWGTGIMMSSMSSKATTAALGSLRQGPMLSCSNESAISSNASSSTSSSTPLSNAPSKRRRRRGVILTAIGFAKVQQAKTAAEFQDNHGNRYTLEALSERTGLAVDTLMKVFACETGVDKQTLKAYFRSFDLTLEPADYYYPDPNSDLHNEAEEAAETAAEAKEPEAEAEPDLPGGQVPLGSEFYIERAAIEADCYKAVLQPGGLIRIKAPRRMGKSSLMSRILRQATLRGCQTVLLSFQLADKAVFSNLDHFLQWFCANVGLGLQIPKRLADYWDDLFGSKISCKIYFEQYLLPQISQPLVLALDDIDRLFEYPDLADEFFGLLRSWHEEAKNREIWKQLRLIVAHSTEVYIPLNVNQSPFNVGLPIELKAFTPDQVQVLAQRHGLDWSEEQTRHLMDWVSGYPYLIQLALYHLWHHDVTLAQLLQPDGIATGIYSDHLQRQLWNLQQNPDLAIAYARVVTAAEPVELDLVHAFKLQSLGLVQLRGNQAVPSCNLYARYFSDLLRDIRSR